jgi:flagellar biosynthesis/type III secretory pathway protein FliH
MKYDNNHPTVSARLPKDKQERLYEVLNSLDITLTQLLLHFIDEYEIKIKSIEEVRKAGYEKAKKEVWQEAYDEGYRKGYDKGYDDGTTAACNCFVVTYPCSKCGEEITVDTEEEKEAIRKFMTDSGWHHGDCRNP